MKVPLRHNCLRINVLVGQEGRKKVKKNFKKNVLIRYCLSNNLISQTENWTDYFSRLGVANGFTYNIMTYYLLYVNIKHSSSALTDRSFMMD